MQSILVPRDLLDAEAEVLVLRQELAVLRRKIKPQLRRSDRLFLSAIGSHALVGERTDAEVILTDVSVAAAAAGWQELRASASLALGSPHLGGDRSYIERALQIAEASRLLGVDWRAHAALAGILDGIDADRHLTSAREAVADLASTIDDDRIRQAFETAASEQIERAIGPS